MVKYISYKQLFIYYKSRKNEGVHMEINIGIIAIVVLAIAILVILASGYVKASPNKAFIISGIKREPKVLIGRAGIKIPFLEKKDELILKQISIDIKTNGYIPTKVDGRTVTFEHRKLRSTVTFTADKIILAVGQTLEAEGLGLEWLLKNVEVLHAFPMHLWKRFETIDRFRAAYPALAARVVRITADGESFEV